MKQKYLGCDHLMVAVPIKTYGDQMFTGNGFSDNHYFMMLQVNGLTSVSISDDRSDTDIYADNLKYCTIQGRSNIKLSMEMIAQPSLMNPRYDASRYMLASGSASNNVLVPTLGWATGDYPMIQNYRQVYGDDGLELGVWADALPVTWHNIVYRQAECPFISFRTIHEVDGVTYHKIWFFYHCIFPPADMSFQTNTDAPTPMTASYDVSVGETDRGPIRNPIVQYVCIDEYLAIKAGKQTPYGQYDQWLNTFIISDGQISNGTYYREKSDVYDDIPKIYTPGNIDRAFAR